MSDENIDARLKQIGAALQSDFARRQAEGIDKWDEATAAVAARWPRPTEQQATGGPPE